MWSRLEILNYGEVENEKRYNNENTYDYRICTNIIMLVVKNRLVTNSNYNFNGDMYIFKFLFKG